MEGAEQSLLPTHGLTRSGSGRSVRSTSGERDVTPPADMQVIERASSPDRPVEPQSASAVSTLSRAIGSLTRGSWGETPTYLEAMSPDSRYIAAEAGVPPPRDSISHNRSNSLRGFLSRAGLTPGSYRAPNRQRLMTERPGSSTSLLLQPQSSRLSTLTSATPPYNSPWASTHSLNISSPVPNSAVRASFEVPRAGLSDDQMRFLGSSEAVNVAGVKLGQPPVGRRRNRTEAAAPPEPEGRTDRPAPPPSWDQVNDERRRGEAEARRSLARAVGQEDERDRNKKDVRHEAAEQAAAESPIPHTSEVGQQAVPPRTTKAPVAPELEIIPPTPISPTSNGGSVR